MEVETEKENLEREEQMRDMILMSGLEEVREGLDESFLRIYYYRTLDEILDAMIDDTIPAKTLVLVKPDQGVGYREWYRHYGNLKRVARHYQIIIIDNIIELDRCLRLYDRAGHFLW